MSQAYFSEIQVVQSDSVVEKNGNGNGMAHGFGFAVDIRPIYPCMK